MRGRYKKRRVRLKNHDRTTLTEWRMNRLAEHGEGIALVFARTETKGFFNEVWRKANAILFLEGRLRFRKPVTGEITGNAGGPSCLVAYGAEAMVRLHRSELAGALVTGWNA